jgi:hypothetical protein
MDSTNDDVSELLSDLYGDAGQRARSAGPRASGSALGGPLAVSIGPPSVPDAFVGRRASLARPARRLSGPQSFTGDPVAATLRRGHNAAVFDAALRKSHVHKLPPHEQLDATRDARIQERWERQQAQWAEFKAAAASRLRRSEGELVMSQSEGYRAVREELALIDKATPKDEVTSPADWMTTLRDSGEEQAARAVPPVFLLNCLAPCALLCRGALCAPGSRVLRPVGPRRRGKRQVSGHQDGGDSPAPSPLSSPQLDRRQR